MLRHGYALSIDDIASDAFLVLQLFGAVEFLLNDIFEIDKYGRFVFWIFINELSVIPVYFLYSVDIFFAEKKKKLENH